MAALRFFSPRRGRSQLAMEMTPCKINGTRQLISTKLLPPSVRCLHSFFVVCFVLFYPNFKIFLIFNHFWGKFKRYSSYASFFSDLFPNQRFSLSLHGWQREPEGRLMPFCSWPLRIKLLSCDYKNSFLCRCSHKW